MQKIGLFAGMVLAFFGMYKIDTFLIPTLDYFGKYVFFGAINIFVFWVIWMFYSKFSGILKLIMPVLFGFIIFSLGLKLMT